jgi:tetratricopeptide (TPR) repeat protein
MKNKTNPNTNVWIYNPALDLIVGCGAWSAPLLLITYYAASSSMMAWSVGFYALALFFNFPHYMATIYRAYHTREDFEKYQIFTVHITLLLLLTLVLSHFWFKALPWIFTLYLTWSPWHYSGQNYGLFAMFTRRAGATPTDWERRCLHATFFLSYLVLFVNFHTGVSHDPLFISLGIPAHAGDVLVGGLGAAFLGCAVFGLRRLPSQVGWRPLVPALTLFSTQFLWFLLPTALSLAERLQVPQSRYSTGVLAIMHSAQYLWITSYYARREAQAQSETNWRPWAYFAVLVAGGIALFIPGPWLASKLFHYDFTSSFLIFTALVNIHHFILDGAIWKLRDRSVASLLLNTKTSLTNARAGAVSGGRWLVGHSVGARTLRITAVCVLFALATIDQARYFLAAHRENLSDLEIAARLDRYDSSLEAHIADQELASGDQDAAVAAWRQAIEANPSDSAQRDQLLTFLIQQQRIEEAYAIASMCVKYTPTDANLLVNQGILAIQLHHYDIALKSWKRAFQIDPSRTEASLYVAQELQRENKFEPAIPYYMTYLQRVAKMQPSNRPPVNTIATVVLQLADCQTSMHQLRDAEESYKIAEKIAAGNNEKKLDSFASVNLASLEANEGRIAEALPLYQRALKLDAGLDDRKGEALDWYNYAILLKHAGFPPRLVYASLEKSKSLAGTDTSGDQLAKIVVVQAEESAALPKQDANVRKNPEDAIEEALSARPAK